MLTASARVSSLTLKHSVKPRPRGRMWVLSCSDVNARANRAAIAASAFFSSEASRFRSMRMTWPPVEQSERMRAMLWARPTFRTRSVGQ